MKPLYIDTDIFYAVLKSGDRHSGLAEEIFSRQERMYTSAITLVELEILVKRELSNEMSRHLTEIFRERFRKVRIVAFDEAAHRKSQELRGKFDLEIFDAIHAATALQGDKKIASMDRAFDRVAGLKRAL